MPEFAPGPDLEMVDEIDTRDWGDDLIIYEEDNPSKSFIQADSNSTIRLDKML